MSGTRLEKLRLHRYGPLEDREIEFEEGLNVFHGVNGSGKTLIVEAIARMLMDDDTGLENASRVQESPNGFLEMTRRGESFDASSRNFKNVFGDITREDIRNAFIIRDQDLRRPPRNNSFGKTSYFQDVTDRVLGARTNKLEALKKEVAEKGRLTNHILDKNPKLKDTKASDKLRSRIDKAESLIERVEGLEDELSQKEITQKFRKMRSLEEELESLEDRKKKLKEAKKQQKHVKGLKLVEEAEEADGRIEELEERENDLSSLEGLESDLQSFEEESFQTGLWRNGFAAFTGLTAVSSAAAFLAESQAAYVAPGVLGLAAAGTLVKWASEKRSMDAQERKRENLLNRAKRNGFKASDIGEAVELIEEDKDEIDSELRDARGRKRDAVGELKGLFSTSKEGLQDWKSFLAGYSERFEENGLDYSEEKLERTREKLQEKLKEKEALEEDLKSHREKLEGLNSEIREALKEEVEVETPAELADAREALETFVEETQNRAEASRDVLEILEEIKQEEGDEFNQILRKGSEASEMFTGATEFTGLDYLKGKGELRLEGEVTEPEKLSQGTYDLLYLSIRMGLASEITGEPGFLVLDNAFAHSDTQRLERELSHLQDMTDRGWQIIYFTYREDTRKQFSKLTDVHEL